jgi:predicted transposase YdaD
MHDPYDRSSKWLIERRGNAILYLGGIRDIQSWRSLQADVVQPRRLPDGLLEVYLHGRQEPDLYLVEIATYPETRVATQVLDDMLLVLLNRRLVPEVLTLVLRPRGNLRVAGTQHLTSRQGWTSLQISWRVVELWTVPADELLAANDVGLIPWVPLTQFQGPPELILEECRRRIDQQAPANERANFLAVTQVLTQLRYNEPGLLSIFGGSRIMIESPLIQELMADKTRKIILRILSDEFGSVPLDIQTALQGIQDEARLEDLAAWAARCRDLNAFRARLSS